MNVDITEARARRPIPGGTEIVAYWPKTVVPAVTSDV